MQNPVSSLIVLRGIDPTPFEKLFDETLSYFHVHELAGKRDYSNSVFLFGGGTDVNPELYGEKRDRRTDFPDRERDFTEKYIFEIFKGRVKGFVGVCRGSQFLNVMNGGKLNQHVEGHLGNHEIETYTGRIMTVTSTHHQMMIPTKDAEILAVANKKDPEIVWYPKTKSLCIQGHPEYMNNNELFPMYCRELISKLILAKEKE